MIYDRKVLFSVGIILYFFVVLFLSFNNHFVQDEVYAINAVRLGWHELLKYIGSSDVHPAGSYLIIKALWQITDSFYITRLILALIGGFFWFLSLSIVVKNEKKISNLLLFFAMPLNPAVLMWCVSLRWYSIWIPAIILLLTYIFFLDKESILDFKVIIPFAVLTYLSYLTFFVFGAVLVSIFVFKNKRTPRKTINLFLYLFLVLPAAMEFFEKAARFSQDQAGSLLKSFLITGYTVFAGSTFFPVSPLPIVFLCVVVFCILFSDWRAYLKNNKEFATFIVLFSLFLVFSGTGAKFKSSIMIHVFFLIFLAGILKNVKFQWIKILFNVVFVIYLLSGIVNVVLIKETAKITYNLPVNEVVQHYENIWKQDHKTVCTDNLSFEYHLNEKGIALSNCRKDLINEDWDVVFVETYECFQRGDCISASFLGKDEYVCKSENFKRDRFNKIKSMLHGSELPEYYVNVTQCDKKE